VNSDLDEVEETVDKDVGMRDYQAELAERGCQGENVIVMAPTNSGKTRVSCRIIQVLQRTLKLLH